LRWTASGARSMQMLFGCGAAVPMS
jgi:hypothetical protein